MSETVFFLDTNVILQCKNLEELPWSEVTAAETIRLVLPGIVCDQLANMSAFDEYTRFMTLGSVHSHAYLAARLAR
jgi:hypothetical protein